MTHDEPAAPPQIPVTVIGGYLGAGKTTLVNNLLRQADGLRIAILVNDFGELPIDADLIESQDDTIINIAGGCVCCSFGSDLISSLFELRDMAPRPEHLLIEASGVALPAAIAESVSLVQEFTLDSIAVLADAETVMDRSVDTYAADTINRQLSSADLIVLNKCDLPTQEVLSATEVWLAEDFPNAVCLQVERAQVPLTLFTGKDTRQGVVKSSRIKEPDTGHHHPTYVTSVLEFAKGLDPIVLAEQLAHHDAGLLRSKGHVESIDGTLYTVQTVGRRAEVRRSASEYQNAGKVVVIAAKWQRGVDELAASLGARVLSAS